MTKPGNWISVSESLFAWEREALEFVRAEFPAHEPYRAWSNFEFIADDGSINEVDLLVFTPQGFFLVEIKSRPGRLFGDAGTWTWETEGRLFTDDNPLIAANLKAKKLSSLLARQKACHKKGRLPFLETLIFCSAPDLRCELTGNARYRVCLRDRTAIGDKPGQPGILAALKSRNCPGLEPFARGTHDRPMAKLVAQAMDQAGIRESQRSRKVGDYRLEKLISDGPGYQDWQAVHVSVTESKRRIRLYLVREGATTEDRRTIERAALREFQLLESLQHPGVLRALNFTEHVVGPALLFEHDPSSMRLDHYLAQRKDKLGLEAQLELVRQLAEIIRFAHDKKIVHRGLSPQSVLVVNPHGDRPRLKVYNWQIGYRETATATPVSRVISPTSHVERLVEDSATAYMAPEAFTDDNTGEHLDVFSLGAIAFHVFSGIPPATGGLDLAERLRGTKGLQISSVLNGAGEWLELMIEQATHPIVGNRTDSVADFQGMLDEVENELSTPEHDYVDDPTQAQAGSLLPGGYKVLRRLGQGACSVALLVERDGQDYVCKIANDTQNNARLQGEADVLAKLRHTNIVEYVAAVEMGDRTAFLLRPAYAEKEKRLIETLGQRLRKDGRLQIELLERFGTDLLHAVNYLEEQGIPHRDIKPDNIAVGMIGRGNRLRLVLFDFSLSRTSPDNIRAGTIGYLDPLLPLRNPVSWDLHAERYAVAVTLHELATGVLPKWGDGDTDPSQLSAGVEITVDAELFDPALRAPLTKFFTKALRRSIKERFHNGEEMLRAWGECFKGLDEPSRLSDHADEAQLDALLANANFETQVSELGLGARATNALDRANILTVEDLLIAPMRRLMRLRGVGNKTRREITTAVKILRTRLGKPEREPPPSSESQEPTTTDVTGLSVDLVVDRLLRAGSKDGDTSQQAAKLLLGIGAQSGDGWLSQTEIADAVRVTRGRVGQIVGKLQQRWAKDPAVTRLRSDLAEILAGQGGVASPRELAEAILVARGSSLDEPMRSRFAAAAVRAAVEVEHSTAEPRFDVSRRQDRILIARNADLAAYARRLGDRADQLAAEDPLVAPARALKLLREVSAPSDAQLTDARLLRLAAEASQSACVSSRQELYPQGLAPSRALKLSQGALLGRRQITEAQIHERVAGRYPYAAPLPNRPALDELLREAGFEFVWNAGAKDGGCYETPLADRMTVTSGSQSVDRYSTSQDPTTATQMGEVTPEIADARQFEERLQRSLNEGSFLTLLVNPKYYDRAADELRHRYPLERIDLEELIVESLRAEAEKARVQWELVLQTDGKPRDGDWDKLLMLVGRAMPAVERRLLAAERTMLVVYAGLLARYGQMDLLSKLSQKVGRRDGIPGLWLLVPGDVPLLDGKAVPLIGPGQRARVPESWLQNVHRALSQQTQSV